MLCGNDKRLALLVFTDVRSKKITHLSLLCFASRSLSLLHFTFTLFSLSERNSQLTCNFCFQSQYGTPVTSFHTLANTFTRFQLFRQNLCRTLKVLFLITPSGNPVFGAHTRLILTNVHCHLFFTIWVARPRSLEPCFGRSPRRYRSFWFFQDHSVSHETGQEANNVTRPFVLTWSLNVTGGKLTVWLFSMQSGAASGGSYGLPFGYSSGYGSVYGSAAVSYVL